uniref:Uncharacterized protein n=1 Tax=Oryza nivara TaxID=4536 RepID=A0A0E0IA59_ORYNI
MASLDFEMHFLLHEIAGCVASPTIANVDDCTEGEGALGYTMTEICDKFIEFFMYKKPQTKDWRKLLVFREEWERYRPYFYKHSQARIDMENDSSMKQKENPTDINGIVARRRKDFNGGFFQHLNFLANAYNGLDERDAWVELNTAFDDILNSSSLDDACDKIKSLAKTKELDSSLILLINRAWAAAKDSTTMKNEVDYTSSVNYGVSRVIHASSSSLLATAVITPDHTLCGFMFPLHLKYNVSYLYNNYTTTKESLKSISPPEMKLLKYLLNIEDPEERFGALATAFSPGDEHEAKDEDALYT